MSFDSTPSDPGDDQFPHPNNNPDPDGQDASHEYADCSSSPMIVASVMDENQTDDEPHSTETEDWSYDDFSDGSAEEDSTQDPPVIDTVLIDLPIYYLNGKYVINRGMGTYCRVGRTSVNIFLKSLGFNDKRLVEGSPLNEVEFQIQKIEQAYAIDGMAELAGWKSGVYRMGQKRVLVPHGPDLIHPIAGCCDNLRIFFTTMLGEEQVQYFYSWLKHTLRGLYNGKFTKGHALILIGDPGCGKTLTREIIGTLMGGRVGYPLSFATGQTAFNFDLAGAELWAIDDETVASTNENMRNKLRSVTKRASATSLHRIHAKFQNAFTAELMVRLIICANKGSDDLAVIPTLDDGLRDKVMAFRCEKATLPPKPDGVEGCSDWALRTVFKDELPALVYWLLHEFEIPADLVDARFGVRNYIHPTVRSELQLITSEGAMWDALVHCMSNNATALDKVGVDVKDARTGQAATREMRVWYATAAVITRSLARMAGLRLPRGFRNDPICLGTMLGKISRDENLGAFLHHFRVKRNGVVHRVWGVLMPELAEHEEVIKVSWPERPPQPQG